MSTETPTSPEATLLAALHARDRWDYEQVVALADPASVAERFHGYCRHVRPRTFDDYAAEFPDTPHERLVAGFERLQVMSPDREAALAPGDFLARWMTADDPRAELVRRLRARERTLPRWLLGPPDGLRYVVLGHVAEGADVVHVRYREVVGPDEPTARRGGVEIESLRRQPDGAWRLLADDWRFLRASGGTAWVLDEELAELWDDDAPSFDAGPSGR